MPEGVPILLRINAERWVNPWFIVQIDDDPAADEIAVAFLNEPAPRRFRGVEREIVLRLIAQIEVGLSR